MRKTYLYQAPLLHIPDEVFSHEALTPSNRDPPRFHFTILFPSTNPEACYQRGPPGTWEGSSFPLSERGVVHRERTGPARGSDTPWAGAKEVSGRGTGDRGRPEGSGRDGEQSYEVIVPEKVGNRRVIGRVTATVPTGGKERTGIRIG